MIRASRPEVRNPVLALPAVAKLQALPPETRALIAEALKELTADCRAKANSHWRKNKGWAAAYWKTVGVYAYHFGRAIRPHKGEA